MNDKASRILYFMLFILGWIGIFWTVYAFFLNAYNGTMEIITENPSFYTLLCVSLISIATAFILEKTVQTKQ
ncbi:MAG: hypothetical protein QXL57_07725 [Candidatus Bathyarchaeia archaeon]